MQTPIKKTLGYQIRGSSTGHTLFQVKHFKTGIGQEWIRKEYMEVFPKKLQWNVENNSLVNLFWVSHRVTRKDRTQVHPKPQIPGWSICYGTLGSLLTPSLLIGLPPSSMKRHSPEDQAAASQRGHTQQHGEGSAGFRNTWHRWQGPEGLDSMSTTRTFCFWAASSQGSHWVNFY